MHLEVLIPDLSWPGRDAAETMHGAVAPTLARWLSRSTRQPPIGASADDWLWRRFTAPAAGDARAVPRDGPAAKSALPIAAVTLAFDGHAPGERWWMRADPVHFIVGRTGLRLAPPAHLQLLAEESEALAGSVRAHFPALATDFLAPGPARWYLGADRPFEIDTTDPADAIGDDVDRNLPRGPGRKQWLGFVNEVQMLWFEHPVNQAREQRGEPTVSGLWLHGSGRMPGPGLPGCSGAAGGGERLAGLATLAGCRWIDTDAGAQHWLGQAIDGHWLLSLDALTAHRQAGDPSGWRAALARLDAAWLAPLDQALHSGRIATIDLRWPSRGGLSAAHIVPADRFRFWRRRLPLAALLADPHGRSDA
ncbi:MAG: hypothetical protein ACK5T2_17905 [bacterium]|nr:hypothetical protein [Betaproteobacteria bacterium]